MELKAVFAPLLIASAVAAGDVGTASALELTPADQAVVSAMRAYNACVGGKRGSLVDEEGSLDPEKIPADLLQGLLKEVRATIADLKSKDPDMPEIVINIVTGMQAAKMVQDWVQERCNEELKPDWPTMNARLKDMQEQRETPYGREFINALNAP